jgi:hypothetical protein
MAWKFFSSNGAEKRIPAIVTTPQAILTPSGSQSIPNSTDTTVAGSVTLDTDGITTTNANKFTIQHAGRYLFQGGVSFDANATGQRYIYFLKQGSTNTYGWQEAVVTGAGAIQALSTAAIIDCAVGDVISLACAQFSGGALNIGTAANTRTPISCVKIDGAVVSYIGVPGSLVGQELAYAEFTTGPLNITQTLQANAQQVVTTPSLSFDGSTAVLIEAWGNVNTPTVLSSYVVPEIWLDGTTSFGFNTILTPAAAQMQLPFHIKKRVVPSAGSHTFQLKAWCSTATGTPQVLGGSGGAAPAPTAIRVTRAA